ncbi:MAG TPA: hypothetical protein VMK65_04955 [Longimicrobiales bacterium]|nr:hypothetical protein [Longimicrobiales bacterium]
MNRAILAAVGVALLAACASAPALPPKAGPEEVELYNINAGQFPPTGYKSIGPVEAQLPLGASNAALMMELRSEAARLGADAVILRNIRNSTEGAAMASSRDEMVIAEGLAIYWPDPATEGE